MISAIIPVYNSGKDVARCLDSVLGQTVRDIEAICVDDGSTDSSADIVAEYARRDPRVRLIRQANTGQGGARNRALDAMRGELFTFVDADDAIHPLFLETLLAAMERGGTAIAVNDRFEKFSEFAGFGADAQALRIPAPKTENFGDFVRNRRIFSSVWNKLYRREAVGDVRFLSHPFEDWPYLVKVFAKAKEYSLTSAPLYFYNAGNVSTIRSPFGERKVAGYLTGIRDVLDAFRGGEMERGARRRAAVAAKMLMSKARKCEPELRRMAAAGLAEIAGDGLLSPGDLDLKTRFRFWRMRREFGL